MRIARLVGLSQDGKSLLVATPSDEELTLAVDDRLHAALRGDRPRLGQLEIEMDNALGPRDIQTRIRAGQSLEEVARVAGMPLDRVERFAAPVLAERQHVALLATASSVRRRGETSGHRVLRVAVAERLAKRGVDADQVDWDAYRQQDGRWSVSASYHSGEAARRAVFLFDLQGRFSVAADDEARWLVGEQSPIKGPQPGRRRPATPEDSDVDGEPTLDLSDELALIRVVQPPQQPDEHSAPEAQLPETGRPAEVRNLHPVQNQPVEEHQPSDEGQPSDEDRLSDEGLGSPLDTLAGMLSSEQEEAQGGEYGGLSDASAVPETDLAGWEPGIVVDYPVEPSAEPEDAADLAVREPPTDPGPEVAAGAGQAPEEPPAPPPALRGPAKRKRAAVPSWDEIMFGGPPRSS